MGKQLKKFKKLQDKVKPLLFETVMSLGGLDSYSNYIGHDYAGWICFLVQTRDSNPLDRSNYETALDALGGETEGKVETRSVGHWDCGYFDQIMVKNDPKNIVKIKKVLELKEFLEDYPVLDDSHFSDLEHEEAGETFENCYKYELDKILGLETLNEKNQNRLVELGRSIYFEDMSYQGLDSASVSEKSSARFLESYEGREYHDLKLIKVLKRLLKGEK